MLSRINRLHIQTSQIEAAMRELINAYNLLPLPKCWGTGKRAAADGSKFQIHENRMPSTILRRLGSNSRKNRLYQAFQALGQVVRTLFLLQYIADRALRQEITACTNIVEGYHNFLDWLFFGKQGVITDHDPEEQEKRLKYQGFGCQCGNFSEYCGYFCCGD